MSAGRQRAHSQACLCGSLRSDNIYGRAQGIAAGLQAFERASALFDGKDVSASAPESAAVRRIFHEFIQRDTPLPSGQKVRCLAVCLLWACCSLCSDARHEQ